MKRFSKKKIKELTRLGDELIQAMKADEIIKRRRKDLRKLAKKGKK